uniref:Uncharacterized protein n=1 Tax=Arundo donax TaxID=35708 RepID=A0A0A9G7W4_ARUDO
MLSLAAPVTPLPRKKMAAATPSLPSPRHRPIACLWLCATWRKCGGSQRCSALPTHVAGHGKNGAVAAPCWFPLKSKTSWTSSSTTSSLPLSLTIAGSSPLIFHARCRGCSLQWGYEGLQPWPPQLEDELSRKEGGDVMGMDQGTSPPSRSARERIS